MLPASPVPPRVATKTGLIAAAFIGLAAVATAAAPRGKTHMLYMGADVEVEHEGAVRRVEGVEGTSFVVVVDGQHVIVPARKGLLNIRIDEMLKVSRTFVTISELKGERAYTPANDPRRKFHEVASAAGAANSGVHDAAVFAVNSGAYAQSLASNDSAPLQSIVEAQTAAGAAMQQFESGISALNGDMNSVGYHASQLQAELAEERYDAFEVTFDISSEHYFEKPYAVVVLRYREQAERPQTARNWIYAQTLPPLTEKSRSIRMLRGGFPPGFHVESYRVHIYDAGVEVATSVSRKRVWLNDDEAFQFAVIEYVGRHRDATLSPRALKSYVPTDIRLRLPEQKINRTLYVKVGKDGRATGAFLDEACAKKISDPDLEEVLLNLRFNPALHKGRAVEGVAPVNLAQLST